MALVQHENLKPWAAITGPERAILHPDLEGRPDEDPDKRWVLAKCVHALRGWIPNQPLAHDPDARYRDQDVEAYARRALMPARPFRVSAQLGDEQLADRFRVPAEKIAERRDELGAEQNQPRRGQLCAELDPRRRRHVAQTPPSEHRRGWKRHVARR